MAEAGIRDLRNNLSKFLERVRDGEELVVTDRVVSVRLVYAEARAALAQAQRLGRITAKNLSAINDELEDLYALIDLMDVGDALVRRAGDLAQHHGLRGYDAIHLAGAERLDDHEVVFAACDAELLQAATGLGIAVSATTAST